MAARTARHENISMNLHHLFCRHPSASMQIIDILGYEQELVCVLRQFRDRLMRSIWLRLANALPSLAIPLPNQFRITRESLRRRQLCRIEVSPVTILATESWDATLSRNARACNNKNSARVGHFSKPIFFMIAMKRGCERTGSQLGSTFNSGNHGVRSSTALSSQSSASESSPAIA